MAFHELDRSIPAGSSEWQSRARDFAREHVLPAGCALDRMGAAEAVAPGSPYFDFLARARAEGFLTLTAPGEYGGHGVDRLTEYLVLEELATGDGGLATSLFIAPLVFQFVQAFGSPRLREELARPYFTGARPEWSSCFAITEPNHGSDLVAVHTPGLTGPGGDLLARADGADWVLNGTKGPWVTCAATASHALVMCTLDRADLARGGIAVVPLDLPGVTRGAPLDKAGLRAANQAGLTFTDVRVPGDQMLLGPEVYAHAWRATHAVASVSMALLAFGTGRAAYEGALRWTHERVQGGRPLHEHQATKLRLFRMFSRLAAARALTRAVYLHNHGLADEGGLGSLAHAAAAKVFTTEVVFEVCDTAAQLCGARSTQRDGVEFADGTRFHPEKLLRDAKAFKLADGENDLLALVGAAQLTPGA